MPPVEVRMTDTFGSYRRAQRRVVPSLDGTSARLDCRSFADIRGHTDVFIYYRKGEFGQEDHPFGFPPKEKNTRKCGCTIRHAQYGGTISVASVRHSYLQYRNYFTLARLKWLSDWVCVGGKHTTLSEYKRSLVRSGAGPKSDLNERSTVGECTRGRLSD
eukprot:8271742-Pyramimonas_sp.AAC.1